MARQLMARGATVTIAARDAAELADAESILSGTGPADRVRGAVCDVRDQAAVRDLFAEVAARHGSVDLVIANAGVIQVAPWESVGTQGFRDAMSTIFEGALHTAAEALPHLRRSRAGGRLALIGSVGGLVAVPHLLPYSCAKSAVATLAEGLRAEETARGVTVTAVHPGLMRTGSPLHARFAGAADRQFAWFSALAGAPLVSMDAERAAERIVSGIERRRPRIVLTPAARLAAAAHGLAPAATTRLLSVVARALPRPDGGRSEAVEGHTLDTPPAGPASRLRRTLSALDDRAADRFNQRGHDRPSVAGPG
ncbi:SDR family NAD(P)-dependent oxidoreductase [Streptomyces netropsis]|uniref:SDR family NAD(P)-dependent oxidoreductase n=1 Tax=Streptomyces netropsis TaxID=55404 RepID=UPI0037A7D2D1